MKKLKPIMMARPVSSNYELNNEALEITRLTNANIYVPAKAPDKISPPEGEHGVQNMAALILLLCVIVKIVVSNIGTAISIWDVILHPIKYWTALKKIVKAVSDIAEKAPEAWEEIKDFKVLHETDDLLRILVDGLDKILKLNVDYSG